MKLPLKCLKDFRLHFVSMLEAIARSIDDIGYLIFNPLRTIRFQEVRDFISENVVTDFINHNFHNLNLYNF